MSAQPQPVPRESTGELQIQEDIKKLQAEVEVRLGRLDELVLSSSKNVELIAEVLNSVKQ